MKKGLLLVKVNNRRKHSESFMMCVMSKREKTGFAHDRKKTQHRLQHVNTPWWHSGQHRPSWVTAMTPGGHVVQDRR